MKKLLLILAFIGMLLAGCTKEPDPSPFIGEWYTTSLDYTRNSYVMTPVTVSITQANGNIIGTATTGHDQNVTRPLFSTSHTKEDYNYIYLEWEQVYYFSGKLDLLSFEGYRVLDNKIKGDLTILINGYTVPRRLGTIEFIKQ